MSSEYLEGFWKDEILASKLAGCLAPIRVEGHLNVGDTKTVLLWSVAGIGVFRYPALRNFV